MYKELFTDGTIYNPLSQKVHSADSEHPLQLQNNNPSTQAGSTLLLKEVAISS